MHVPARSGSQSLPESVGVRVATGCAAFTLGVGLGAVREVRMAPNFV